MFDIVRRMRERERGTGGFDVLDGTDTRVGFMDFIPSDGRSVVAKSTWGSLEVRHAGDSTGVTVSLNGKPLASITFARMYMRMSLRMASGQEMPFKMTLFTDVLYHKSNLGDFRYKFKMPGDEGGTARCSVTVKESYGVKGEDVTLALLSFYGYQCLSYWDAIETVYGPAKSEVQKN